MPIIKENGTKISADRNSIVEATSNDIYFESFGSMMMDMAINEATFFNYLIEADFAELDAYHAIKEDAAENAEGKKKLLDGVSGNPFKALYKLVTHIIEQVTTFISKRVGSLRLTLSRFINEYVKGGNWLKNADCSGATIKSYAKPNANYKNFAVCAVATYKEFSQFSDSVDNGAKGFNARISARYADKSSDEIFHALIMDHFKAFADTAAFRDKKDLPSVMVNACFEPAVTGKTMGDLGLTVGELQNALATEADVDAIQKEANAAIDTLKKYKKILEKEAKDAASNAGKDEKKEARSNKKEAIKTLRTAITGCQKAVTNISNIHIAVVSKHKAQIVAALRACEAYAKSNKLVKGAKKVNRDAYKAARKSAKQESALLCESAWLEGMADFYDGMDAYAENTTSAIPSRLADNEFSYLYENDVDLSYDDEDED